MILQAIVQRHSKEVKQGGSIYITRAEQHKKGIQYTYIVDNGYGRITTYTMVSPKREILKSYTEIDGIEIYAGMGMLKEVQKKWEASSNRIKQAGQIHKHRILCHQPDKITKWSKRLLHLQQYMNRYARSKQINPQLKIPNYSKHKLDRTNYELVISTQKGKEYRLGLSYGYEVQNGDIRELFSLQKTTSIADVQDHFKQHGLTWLIPIMDCYDLRKRVEE